MAREVHYNSAEAISPKTAEDPYLRPSFPLSDRICRQIWKIVWILFFRYTPRNLHGWRSMILRIFGAKLGKNCHIYPGAILWAPWNLVCDEQATIADGAEVYNPVKVYFGSHAILSQGAYLCAATHDYDDPAFPLTAHEMTVGAYSWICARAILAPGVQVGEGAILGIGAVAVKDLEPWSVYAGNPALKIKERKPR